MKPLIAFALAATFTLAACNNTTPDVNERTPSTPKDSLSYAIGMMIGKSLQRDSLDIDLGMLASGIIDQRADKPLFNDSVAQTVFMALQQAQMKKMQEAQAKSADSARKAGEEYLAKNKSKSGVTVTSSGLQIEFLKMGTGPKPTAENTVRVHYTGTLIDGSIFDSSVQRGEPVEFPLKGVIPGWTEALQLMPVGSKARLVIPAQLAYGDQGMGQSIPPGATLVFEVELLEIVKK